MSHALSRLRELLGDPLLVRTPSGMQPTPRAAAMAVELEAALDTIGRLLASPAPFVPQRATRKFRIAANDYMELVLLPGLLARLWKEAPNVDVAIVNLTSHTNEDLAEGRMDLAMGVVQASDAHAAPKGIRSQRIVSDTFVCVVRDEHPVVRKRLSLDTFVALPHALVAPRGQAGSIVDTALARLGKRRRVAIEVPHFLVAPHVVAENDVVLTLATRVAKNLGPMLGLRQLAPPIELSGFSMAMTWHERQHADPAHAWLRGVVSAAAEALR